MNFKEYQKLTRRLLDRIGQSDEDVYLIELETGKITLHKYARNEKGDHYLTEDKTDVARMEPLVVKIEED